MELFNRISPFQGTSDLGLLSAASSADATISMGQVSFLHPLAGSQAKHMQHRTPL